MRKKRIILWAVVLAVVVVAAGLYPVISKQMNTPRVTWYLELPAGLDIRAVSPNGRYFVAGGSEGRLYLAKEGDSKWTELPTRKSNYDILVSDLGTVLREQYPPEWHRESSMVTDWYWYRAGEKGVRMDPKLSPTPREFLEGSDDWIGVYGKSQDKLGVFKLSGSLVQPIEAPIKGLAGLDERWISLHMVSNLEQLYGMHWDFHALDPRLRRYFVRIGTKFEERTAPPMSSFGAAVSYDGRWVAVSQTRETCVYHDGVLKETMSSRKPPSSTGLDAIRDLFDQYVLRKPRATVFTIEEVTGFDLNGKRRVGYVHSDNMRQGYVQDGGDRFYASELGLRPSDVTEEFPFNLYSSPDARRIEEFPRFNYISPDGRRIIGSQVSGLFVFAIDR